VIKNILWFYLCPRLSLFRSRNKRCNEESIIRACKNRRNWPLSTNFSSQTIAAFPIPALKSTRDTPRGWPDKLCWKLNLRILSYSGLIRGNDRSKTDQRGIMYGNSASISCPPTHSPKARLVSPPCCYLRPTNLLAVKIRRGSVTGRKGWRKRGKKRERKRGREGFAWWNDCFSARRIFIELSKLYRHTETNFISHRHLVGTSVESSYI